MREPVPVDFGPDVSAEIEKYCEQQLDWLEQAHADLHKNKIPKWRKAYLGVPAEASRNWPFPNAANTVVQVVGETVDTMVARVMGLIYATHPLWPFQNYTLEKDPQALKDAEVKKRIIQDFMDIVGFEPTELNLQQVEAEWFTDAAKLGTSFAKVSLEFDEEAVVVGYDNDAKKIKGTVETIYEGPKVTKVRHEDVLADASYNNLRDCPFVAVRRALKRLELEERAHKGIYDKDVVRDLMTKPDRSTPKEQTRQELADKGIATPAYPESTAEWEVFECYFWWWYNKRKYRLIYTYHKATKKVLRKIFNFIPKNELPVLRAKLGYRSDGLYGQGYAELLEIYQEELSTQHNQRLDNATVANVRALRVSPRARALDSNMELYPAALLIAEKDEIEAIQVGDVYPSSYKNEEMTLQLVARRAGITPAISGAGTGGMMKKPAVYSAQGTLAVMQESNSVVGFATSEFRIAHVMLGSMLTALYGAFGTGGREVMFGIDSGKLKAALKEFEKNRMKIPIRAATASLNKEVDKQAGMLMAGLLQRHQTAVGQLLQACANPMVPPDQRAAFIKFIVASNMFHQKVFKDFGYEQPELFIPEVEPSEQQDKGGLPAGGMAPGGAPVAGSSAAPAPGGGGGVPFGGMGSGGAGGGGAAGFGPAGR